MSIKQGQAHWASTDMLRLQTYTMAKHDNVFADCFPFEFKPTVNLRVKYRQVHLSTKNFPQVKIRPVYRGNIMKPSKVCAVQCALMVLERPWQRQLTNDFMNVGSTHIIGLFSTTRVVVNLP